MSYRVLITSSPMRQIWPAMEGLRAQFPADYVLADPVQQNGGPPLLHILPTCDAWIAGAEEINEQVLKTGHQGRLRALVRWGVGMDNVDHKAAAALGIALDRTPDVFGDEVADLGIGYMLALSRQIVTIDRQVRAGNWLRPPGVSLRGKTAAVVGYGNIGQNLVAKLEAFGLRRVVYSQHRNPTQNAISGNADNVNRVLFQTWPQEIEEIDFLFLVCALNESNYRMVSSEIFRRLKPTSYVINLGRGALVDETALIAALRNNEIAGAALDVFQEEPLPSQSPLREFENVVLGSHNASNTHEGAVRASDMALRRVFNLLER